MAAVKLFGEHDATVLNKLKLDGDCMLENSVGVFCCWEKYWNSGFIND